MIHKEQKKYGAMLKTVCKHYSYGPSMEYKCDLGLKPVELAGKASDKEGERFGIATRLPCNSMKPMRGVKGTCSKKELPTDEEVQKELKVFDRISELAIFAMTEIRTRYKNGDTGIVTCPKCQGNLRFSIEKNSGKIAGQCETNKCLFFM